MPASVQLPATDLLYYQVYISCAQINRMLCLYNLMVIVITTLSLMGLSFGILFLYFVYLVAACSVRLQYHNRLRAIYSSLRVYYLVAERTMHLLYIDTNDYPR